MREVFINTLLELAQSDSSVYLVTGDLGFGILKPFWDKLPKQFINLGIAEQNMTGFSAGMALEGKTVFTYSIGNFPTLRCLEQIRNDCAYHNANVKIVSVGGGLSYGALGMSHHATEDLAVMRALPGVLVLAPADLSEAEGATRAVYEHRGTCYLRLGRGGEGRIHTGLKQFQIGKAYPVGEGKEVALLSTGTILSDVIAAGELLKKQGINPGIYSFPTVKPIDREFIQECALRFHLLVTVEEHNITGGFGSAVCEAVSELGTGRASVLRVGIQDQYISTVGSQEYLKSYCGLDAAGICRQVMTFLNRGEGKS